MTPPSAADANGEAVPSLLRRLAAGIPVTALGVRSARTPEIARLARATGHDLIWVDLEHSSMPIDAAAQICCCAHDLGMVSLVRVPERDYGVIGRLLDGGAMGVIAPRIETAAQAADVVAACRFPPLGHRSAIGQLPTVRYRRMPAATLNEVCNRNTLVKVLIESAAGIANLAEIAAVPGVDLIGIGANDLSAELGVPGVYRDPVMRAALDVALEACRRAGKPLAIGGIADPAHLTELIDQGAVPFMMTGIDTDMLLGAAQERHQKALSFLSIRP
jgi:4-hydroxy-2-oxoheptanedioate aldolase